jgi:hypothetical protein
MEIVVTRRGLLGRAVGMICLFASRNAEAAQSKLADDIPVAADWIARALTSSGYKADFSPASITEIERFFQTHVKEGKAVPGGLLSQDLGGRLFALGSYCGEVLRRELGGRWLTDDSDPRGEIDAALELTKRGTCWPMQRVMKRFDSAEYNLVHWASGIRKG